MNYYEEEKDKSFIESYKESIREHPFWNIFFIIAMLMLANNFFNMVVKDINLYQSLTNPVANSYIADNINVNIEPTQIPTKKGEFYFAGVSGSNFIIIPKAEYSVSALVIGKNHNLWQTGNFLENQEIKFAGDIFPLEFVLAWGEVANSNYKRYLSYKFKKFLFLSKDFFYPKIKDNSPYPKDYVASHLSHVRIVSANRNVMSALYSVKTGEKVKIYGYLADVGLGYSRCIVGKTSLSTSEKYSPNADIYNKIVYATQVQIGHRLYR